MSRIVGGDYIFGWKEKEMFIWQMWRLANFMGIQILDYSIMSNHYHQLLEVPGVVALSDKELIERLAAYYGENSPKVKSFAKNLQIGGKEADRLRAEHMGRMGDISEFQKHLKQGFTRWYNRQHKRKGTLWMERFKSILVEDILEARKIISSYIDLNPVRANMVEDPKNYRHCGYAAALGGDDRCRKGIMRVMGLDNWEEAASQYRILLMVRGHKQISGKKGSIKRELLLKTLEEDGHLPMSDLLRLRIRYFSDGLVLGSECFVENIFQQYRSHFGHKRKSGARPIKELPTMSLKVLRDLRESVIS